MLNFTSRRARFVVVAVCLCFVVCFYNYIVPMRFLPWEIRVAFPGQSQLRQSRATQPTVHAGSLSVSIIHRTLTWTTNRIFDARIDVNACDYAGGCTDTVRESALKVDSGRKIPCRTRESNLSAACWCAGPMLYQLSYIPTQ